ncbi:hypothetical protein ADICYQ_5481 [Cyclobacterium qasimii M12-11B]|uniref:Uncharacterized protein n=1 Tax=Cyclobacterium qasimii M12-11B TaxID=641524 RepID=S7V5V0_9BACT|nr:hypothetical protein ADICYQ_5481 [Cyclobacterium qasimii M12-11B]
MHWLRKIMGTSLCGLQYMACSFFINSLKSIASSTVFFQD